MLKDVDGFLWYVKGYEHPPWGYVVVPYRGSPGMLAKLVYLPCVGRDVYVLLKRFVAEVIDPERALKESNVDKRIKELIDLLNPEWAGLTGSRAVGLARPKSDYDVLLYSSRPEELYRTLRDLRDQGLIGECALEERWRKVSDTFDYDSFVRLHSLKVLDSCFKGVPYTIRVLAESRARECSSTYFTLGHISSQALVKDVGAGYLTPATYAARLLDLNLDATITTWRTRYQELPSGTYFVNALLQLRLPGKELVVEPDLGGYLRPTRSWELSS